MYDFFFKWADEAEAWADRMALAEYLGIDVNATTWNQSVMLPNVKAWRPSQDVFTTDSPPKFVRHTYLAGWFAIIATPSKAQILLNDNNLQFCLDRRAWNAQTPPYIVKNNIGAVLQDVACEPIFAGSNYPVNGYTGGSQDSPAV
jgi:hypothetical protein